MRPEESPEGTYFARKRLSYARHRYSRDMMEENVALWVNGPLHKDISAPVKGDVVADIIPSPASLEQPARFTGTSKFREEDISAARRNEFVITEFCG